MTPPNLPSPFLERGRGEVKKKIETPEAKN